MTTTNETGAATPPRTGRRRIRRWILGVLLGLVGLVGLVVLVVVLLLLPPVREGAFDIALRKAGESLPGRLSVAGRSWPSPGDVRLSGLQWTDEGDTLLAADEVRLAVRLGPLLRKDVVVEEVSVLGLRADAGAIEERLPAAAPAGEKPVSPPPFPRPGSLPGIPSIAVESIRLTAPRIAYPGGQVRDAVLEASLDLLHGSAPALKLARLAGRDSAGTWAIEEGRLDLDLAGGESDGRIRVTALEEIPVLLELAGSERDSISLKLGLEGDAWRSVAAGLNARAQLERNGTAVEGVRATITIDVPGTEDLKRFPGLEEALAEAPVLEGFQALVESAFRFEDGAEGTVALRARPNTWLEELRASVEVTPGGVEIDTVVVRLPDLLLTASGLTSKTSMSLAAALAVDGPGALALAAPEARLPDSLTVRGTFEISGPPDDPAGAARVVAFYRQEKVRVDRVEINVTAPSAAEPIRVDLRAEAFEHGLVSRAELTSRDPIRLSVPPIQVRYGGLNAAFPSPPDPPGRIALDPETNGWSIRNLRLIGDLGRLFVDGDLDLEGTSRFRADYELAKAPPLARTALEDPALADSLATALARGGPVRLALAGSYDARTPARAELTGDIRLPAPGAFTAFLPPEARVGDWSAVRGKLRGSFDVAAQRFDGSLDLSETGWLAAVVKAHGESTDVVVDTLRLALDDLTLAAGGRMTDGSLAFDGTLAIEGVELLSRFAGAALDSSALALRLDATVRGTAERPMVSAALAGSLQTPQATIPRIEGRVEIDETRIAAALEGPSGLATPQLALDTWALRAEGAGLAAGAFPLDVTLRADGRDAGLLADLAIERDSTLTVAVDSIFARYLEKNLATRHPFAVTLDEIESRLTVDDMRLEGTLGVLTGNGFSAPDRSDLDVDLRLTLPDSPPNRNVPVELWPDRFEVRLRADSSNVLRAEVEVAGFALGSHDDVRMTLSTATDSDGTTFDAFVKTDDRDLLKGRGKVPFALALYPFSTRLTEEPLDATLDLDALPFSARLFGAGAPEDREIRVDGSIAAWGDLERPSFRTDGTVSFPDWPRLGTYAFAWDARAGGAAVGNGSAAIPDSSLSATFGLRKGERAVLTGSVAAGLPDPEKPEETPVEIRIDSQPITLSDFDALLPASSHLLGTCELDFDMEGTVGDAQLGGRFRSESMGVSLVDGSRGEALFDLKFGGTTKRPAVEGRIEVLRGTIRIPDPPRTLHPTSGRSRLWTTPDTTAAPGTPEPTLPEPGAPPPADIDVRVTIPSGLWIRGQGMDIELAGDLSVIQRGVAPTVTGDLQAVRGRLVFVGRAFELQRGLVTFYGDDAIDPALDLQLGSRVADVSATIAVTGTAKKPELTLTSDPEMPEGDIMSLLLFGKPLDDLNTDQVGLVQTRAAEVAASLAATQLEQRLSQQLGLDMVTIKSGSESGDGSRLVFGEYLSRKVLLRYEQALESSARFFVNLEYLLSNRFKLETLFGSQSQSAVELNYSVDY